MTLKRSVRMNYMHSRKCAFFFIDFWFLHNDSSSILALLDYYDEIFGRELSSLEEFVVDAVVVMLY